jgi:hypothetical protein
MYAEDGTKGTTHIKYRGERKPIKTEQEVRVSTDLGYGVASSARVMPVYADIGQGANAGPRIMPILAGQPATIKDIVIYRKNEE